MYPVRLLLVHLRFEVLGPVPTSVCLTNLFQIPMSSSLLKISQYTVHSLWELTQLSLFLNCSPLHMCFAGDVIKIETYNKFS